MYAGLGDVQVYVKVSIGESNKQRFYTCRNVFSKKMKFLNVEKVDVFIYGKLGFICGKQMCPHTDGLKIIS